MLLTLDSSVIVAALRSQEPFYENCRRVMVQVRDGHHTAVQPLTVLVEVAAAIRRRTGSEALAHRVYRDLRSLGFLCFVELDLMRADQSVEIVRQTGVRGMDAILVQVAREFGTVLVTLDAEMLDRVKEVVETRAVATF